MNLRHCAHASNPYLTLFRGVEMAATVKNIKDAPKKAIARAVVDEFGDVFNAKQFALKHEGKLVYSPQRGMWYEFKCHAWRADELRYVTQHAIEVTKDMLLDVAKKMIGAAQTGSKAAIEEAEELLRHAKQSQNKARIEAMVSLAQTDPRLTVSQGLMDGNDMLLGVKNGVIELDKFAFRDGEPGDYITRLAGCEFDGDAECPAWLAFLAEVQPDPDVRAWLQRFAGYCLTGRVDEQIFVVNHGLGANGKSVFWDTLRKLLGDYATTAQFDTFVEKNSNDSVRNDIARLDKTRLVIANEGQHGARLDEGMVKQITGGDEITARFLHREFFTFKPKFKVVLVTNHKPVISGNDHGIWRRVVLVPWSVTIPTERRDRRLADKLEAELPGILAWALEGLQKYLEAGLSELPMALVKANADYRKDSDVIGLWINDCAELDKYAKTPLRDVYNSYKGWADENGHKPMASKSLGDRLKERGVTDVRIGAAGTRGWSGIRLSHPA